LSTYATKEELEKVKGMIGVSARVVGNGVIDKQFISDNSKDTYKSETFNFQLPECDYVELQSLNVSVPDVGSAILTPNKVVLVPGSGEAVVTVRMVTYSDNRNQTVSSGISFQNVSFTADYALTGTIYYSYTVGRTAYWYYTCYKYDS